MVCDNEHYDAYSILKVTVPFPYLFKRAIGANTRNYGLSNTDYATIPYSYYDMRLSYILLYYYELLL